MQLEDKDIDYLSFENMTYILSEIFKGNKPKIKHFKGDKYEVLNIVEDAITGEAKIMYRKIKTDDLFVRPIENFFEVIKNNSKENILRFKYIK